MLALWQASVDLGDQVSVTGEVITTRHGELTVHADQWAMACKSLRPIPGIHAELTDPDARLRQRYLDLILQPQLPQRGHRLHSQPGIHLPRGLPGVGRLPRHA